MCAWLFWHSRCREATSDRDRFDPERREIKCAVRVASVLSVPGAVLAQIGETPGLRLAGLEVVYARTGTPVGLRAGTARVGLRLALDVVTKRLVKALTAGEREFVDQHTRKLRELAPELRALQEENADDPAAVTQAMRALYEQRGISTDRYWKAMGSQLGIAIVLGFLSRRLQRDITGTVTVVEP